jgi:hypothetical protein
MSGSPLSDIQEAIYTLLTNDPELMNKITNVYDFTPDNEDYPYVVIGEFTSSNWDTYQRHGEDVTVTIHVWSNSQGMKQIEEIMNDVNRLLVRRSFDIESWQNVGCMFDYSSTFAGRSPSGSVIRHGILRYRLLVLQELAD